MFASSCLFLPISLNLVTKDKLKNLTPVALMTDIQWKQENMAFIDKINVINLLKFN